jgi:hypothetical protein
LVPLESYRTTVIYVVHCLPKSHFTTHDCISKRPPKLHFTACGRYLTLLYLSFFYFQTTCVRRCSWSRVVKWLNNTYVWNNTFFFPAQTWDHVHVKCVLATEPHSNPRNSAFIWQNIIQHFKIVFTNNSFFFFFLIPKLELRAFTSSHSTSPFCDGYFFRDRVSKTICPGWLQTSILLISASWVARITGVSHQHPAQIILVIWKNITPKYVNRSYLY